MHDFDYDAMQKKRIAHGASHMKRGSKSKKCTLPSDYLTAAQKRRLNGPVSTYKLDEPMKWESFKTMPEDLQKKYILNLQETYQTTDEMLGMMFGKSNVTVGKYRAILGIDGLGHSKFSHEEKIVRNAKWNAFCNGVVGGKPGEIKEPEKVEEIESYDYSDSDWKRLKKLVVEVEETDVADKNDVVEVETPVDILIPDHVSASFIIDAGDIDKAFKKFKLVTIPKGKVRIRFEVEAV